MPNDYPVSSCFCPIRFRAVMRSFTDCSKYIVIQLTSLIKPLVLLLSVNAIQYVFNTIKTTINIPNILASTSVSFL